MATSWPREPSIRREPGAFPARRTSNRLSEGAIHGTSDLRSAHRRHGGAHHAGSLLVRRLIGERLQLGLEQDHDRLGPGQRPRHAGRDRHVNLHDRSRQEVKVTFPQTGTVEYFCSFHHALGMAGELSVA
ncbi:MAG: hypothetical protein E6G54_07205 [Actinobacteria bacterium]|nr:MAG: hypothetical protein E6G54_07205 [Actinomycetota bacterium]